MHRALINLGHYPQRRWRRKEEREHFLCAFA
jgi:hypothetical protein